MMGDQRDQRNSDAKKGAKPPGRKPYRTPRLERLGTLSELTAATATSGRNDHANAHATFRKS
jgi:hypothetical protein